MRCWIYIFIIVYYEGVNYVYGLEGFLNYVFGKRERGRIKEEEREREIKINDCLKIKMCICIWLDFILI